MVLVYLPVFIKFLHILGVIIWIGAHFFQLLTLDPSLRVVGKMTSIDLLGRLFPRFNTVTGIGAILTVSSGTMLAMIRAKGTMAPLVMSAWGISLVIGLLLVLLILLIHFSPRTIQIMSKTSMGLLILSVILALVETGGELSVFLLIPWGQVIMVGAILGMAIFLLGFILGQNRVMIAIECSSLIQKASIDEGDANYQRFLRLRRRLLLLTIPENVLTIAVLVLMVYAAYLPI